jgi:transcriptional regulator with XRE-family HTH domain
MELGKISQADICRDLKVSSATASDWYNGNKFPRSDKIQRLADLLGVRLSSLTTENGPEDYEYQRRLEALHKNPKLRMLFDIQMGLKPQSLDAVTAVVKEIAKERGEDD